MFFGKVLHVLQPGDSSFPTRRLFSILRISYNFSNLRIKNKLLQVKAAQKTCTNILTVKHILFLAVGLLSRLLVYIRLSALTFAASMRNVDACECRYFSDAAIFATIALSVRERVGVTAVTLQHARTDNLIAEPLPCEGPRRVRSSASHRCCV